MFPLSIFDDNFRMKNSCDVVFFLGGSESHAHVKFACGRSVESCQFEPVFDDRAKFNSSETSLHFSPLFLAVEKQSGNDNGVDTRNAALAFEVPNGRAAVVNGFRGFAKATLTKFFDCNATTWIARSDEAACFDNVDNDRAGAFLWGLFWSFVVG